MGTVSEYIDRQSQQPLAFVIGRHGVNADLPTNLSDYMVATMHALDAVYRGDSEVPDPRAAVVADVELALKHYLTESFALRVEPDETEDILGGYPMPFVQVAAELDQVVANIQRRACPECGTEIDEDGYCTDVGCVNCGKTVS